VQFYNITKEYGLNPIMLTVDSLFSWQYNCSHWCV